MSHIPAEWLRLLLTCQLIGSLADECDATVNTTSIVPKEEAGTANSMSCMQPYAASGCILPQPDVLATTELTC
jgi:hypothetical protein